MATAQLAARVSGKSPEGLTVGYTDEGSGPPLVLVHGHPFDRTMWAPQVDAFTPTHRVIAPDLRGYGESDVVPGITPLSSFADDIAALLDHLGIERAVLGGLSMGGQIVMECYRLFPHRITGLVLADTFPAAETQEGKRSRNAAADRLLAEGMKGYADEVLDRMVAPYNTEAAAHVHRMMTAASPEGAAAALRGRAQRSDYRDLLTRVSVPTLVVVGRDDTYTPVADAEAMHAAIPGSTLAVIESSAHLPNLERPGAFNAVLRDHLDLAARAVPGPGAR
ncbi:hydrolase [Streptomyces agglomeratus]|uniref:alpha/beta fold hydrolase n=1 Tax=Streptomyces agglomeratus TaxID=285458 RepID=UPI0008540DD2|nr:alpha/beta fold hydrolase [Streptomyces agglomeratus]OEJ40008.1 hydrolase [Streptomyces agglomeratus]OEJ45610.1 hydrolase [Streptomyces agglomeratus]OEJ59927.1 hydrolase [Streptomyces agglomeratus]